MEEKLLAQSSPRRAWKDTTESFHKIWFFWGVEVVATGAFIFLGTILTPEDASRLVSAIYPTVGGVIGAIVGFGIIYLICLFRAPYKQRNEARTLLETKRKPIPLPNRNELIKAIAEVKTTTLKYIHLQDTQSTRTLAEVTQAHECYENAIERLESERLVAGKEYDAILLSLDGFIIIQTILSRTQDIVSEDVRKGKLRGAKLDEEFKRFVDKIISKIEVTSQPNFDTRGSPTE